VKYNAEGECALNIHLMLRVLRGQDLHYKRDTEGLWRCLRNGYRVLIIQLQKR